MQKIKLEIKICFVFFYNFPKLAKTVFDLKNSKTIFLPFSSVFVFKQAKEPILFQVQPLKIINTKLFLLILG